MILWQVTRSPTLKGFNKGTAISGAIWITPGETGGEYLLIVFSSEGAEYAGLGKYLSSIFIADYIKAFQDLKSRELE
jgi:hypothetical protein